MNSENLNFQPFDIGKILFYEVNNPVQPIEIECVGIKTGRVLRIYTKNADAQYNNYSVNESNIGGADLLYFALSSGKIYANLPLYIKNNVDVFVTRITGDPKKIFGSYKGAIVGIRGIFNDISWVLLKNPLIDLQTHNFSRVTKIDTSKSFHYNGKSYYSEKEVSPGALIECSNFLYK